MKIYNNIIIYIVIILNLINRFKYYFNQKKNIYNKSKYKFKKSKKINDL